MAIKRTYDRYCSTCGEPQLFNRSDSVRFVTYIACRKKACRSPGPFNPPKMLELSEIIINEAATPEPPEDFDDR